MLFLDVALEFYTRCDELCIYRNSGQASASIFVVIVCLLHPGNKQLSDPVLYDCVLVTHALATADARHCLSGMVEGLSTV